MFYYSEKTLGNLSVSSGVLCITLNFVFENVSVIFLFLYAHILVDDGFKVIYSGKKC